MRCSSALWWNPSARRVVGEIIFYGFGDFRHDAPGCGRPVALAAREDFSEDRFDDRIELSGRRGTLARRRIGKFDRKRVMD
jgi:hypothetical protein